MLRLLAATLIALLLAAPARAESPPPTAEQFEHEKKSVALAVTMEAISPIAGVGGFYAGDSDHATVLAVVSGAALVVGAGSLLWLLHLEDQHAGGGFDRVELDAEQGSAISLLVVAGVAYLMARISGLALAPDATHAYNDELRARLGLPPPEPVIPFHALAPVPTLTFRF